MRNKNLFEKKLLQLSSGLMELKRMVGDTRETAASFRKRIEKHLQFVEEYHKRKGGVKYLNNHYRFPIITKQETDLLLNQVLSIRIIDSKNFHSADYKGWGSD